MERVSTGNVVERAFWLVAIQEPQPLLSERERRRALYHAPLQPQLMPSGLRLRHLLHHARQPFQRRILEQCAERNFDTEHDSDSRNHVRCEERMAAQVEEIIVQADVLYTQSLHPDAGDPLFY